MERRAYTTTYLNGGTLEVTVHGLHIAVLGLAVLEELAARGRFEGLSVNRESAVGFQSEEANKYSPPPRNAP